ncbi:hypothetical protein FH972_018948 [Carpinus fangiana]|uniref:Uncharacterized protein n=1 Tax=Carpinus fangiana TaxID=176857 RepID=A0A5N6RNL8_9ROSI|nr:hypothetical protein FH972_018948 [Carpinus fangiana]
MHRDRTGKEGKLAGVGSCPARLKHRVGPCILPGEIQTQGISGSSMDQQFGTNSSPRAPVCEPKHLPVVAHDPLSFIWPHLAGVLASRRPTTLASRHPRFACVLAAIPLHPEGRREAADGHPSSPKGAALLLLSLLFQGYERRR